MQSIQYVSAMIKKASLLDLLGQFVSLKLPTLLLPLEFSELVQDFGSLLCVYQR